MSEVDILRIQTNLQIATALFAVAFFLAYIVFSRRPNSSKDLRADGWRTSNNQKSGQWVGKSASH